MLLEIQSRIKQPHYVELRDAVVARIKSGKLTEDTPVSAVLDSLDTVELTMELEELGIETTVPINSVGDLLWMFKALDLRRQGNHSVVRTGRHISGFGCVNQAYSPQPKLSLEMQVDSLEHVRRKPSQRGAYAN